MILRNISILNYKNVAEAHLDFSPNVNCLIGDNGMGKTNILDAIYYLSFCKGYINQSDASVIRHGEPFMMLQGKYTRRDVDEDISVSLQRGKRKVVRRGGKEYQRLSQHIGLLPLVMVSPMDWDLIRGASEERRRFMDQIISQGNPEYLDALIKYNKALEQRNSMIRRDFRDALLYETVEGAMCDAAQRLHEARRQWVEVFTPIFMDYYHAEAGDGEQVSLCYDSVLNGSTMHDVLAANRERDMVLGYTSRGVHRDDLELMLGDHSMRRTGSQGQCKTYTIALRMAQYEFLRKASPTTPILLLDDLFDKLDTTRVSNLLQMVSGTDFGQIFLTDSNKVRIRQTVDAITADRTYFETEGGVFRRIDE